MPQIDLKNMYLGCYFLSKGNNKMYDDELAVNSIKSYISEVDIEEDFHNGILRLGENFEFEDETYTLSFEKDGSLCFNWIR